MTLDSTLAALALIEGAHDASDLFGDRTDDPAGLRTARVRHRRLVAAVHPDRAAALGVDPARAEQATATLNALYDAWMQAPHLVGPTATHVLRARLWTTDATSCYRTDDPLVRVEITRRGGGGARVAALAEARTRLARHGLGAFVPEIVDEAVTSGHRWLAYRLPDGLHSLREVRTAYRAGLDGRDWAWMARRILMTLDAAERMHGGLTLDTVLIHPRRHGVVLTGWVTPPRSEHQAATDDGAAIATLFDEMLAADESRQRRFACGAAQLNPRRTLAEYDLLLRHLYGPRRFRPFTLPALSAG